MFYPFIAWEKDQHERILKDAGFATSFQENGYLNIYDILEIRLSQRKVSVSEVLLAMNIETHPAVQQKENAVILVYGYGHVNRPSYIDK